MLKILPEKISNLIAAGEVIQRPASVVKELLENSVDAGATSITLIIGDYGKTLIQVLDNGCGMNREEAKLCFTSHATSKISSIEDIESIRTFGFRGEALASIAACSDVVLKTRKAEDEIGTQVHIESGKIESVADVATAAGCNIAVRNIFYNIPARRKFLKTDASEYRQIVNEFTRVALTRLDIEFSFISNSKEIFRLAAGETLKQRIAILTNASLLKISKELIDVNIQTGVVEIGGYIGTPHSAKKSQQNTYLFINNRFFRSPLLHKAVMNGYRRLIPEDITPSYFIFLTVPAGEYDVNISPSKTEVKFENEQAIFQILEATVKEAIGKNAFAPVIEFGEDDVPQEISSADGFTMTPSERASHSFRPPQITYDPLFNPFKTERAKGEEECIAEPKYEEYSAAHFLDLGDNLVAVKNPKGEGILVIDIVRAKQRIFYENYIKTVSGKNIAIQQELFPKTVSLDHVKMKVLSDNAEYLKSIGFEIRPFGKESIVVSGTPSNFNGEKFSVEDCIEEIADMLLQNNTSSPDAIDPKAIALKVLRFTNFTPQLPPSQGFVSELVMQLLRCSEPAVCPMGGYCFTVISKEQINKQLL